MRTSSALLLLFAFVFAPAASGGEFKLFAEFIEDTRVELSDGAVWQMDKGDVFPVESYKNQQKNIVLRIAGATFMTETARTRILKPPEVAAGLEIYRKNVRSYLDSTSKKIEQKLVDMEEQKKKLEPKPVAPAPAATPNPPATPAPEKKAE
jgi:hypothetical protein